MTQDLSLPFVSISDEQLVRSLTERHVRKQTTVIDYLSQIGRNKFLI